MSAANCHLRTDNYVFPLSTRTLEPGVTQILVGNPRHHPRPCVEILVSRKATAVLEGLMYASTCSTVPLEPTAGTREMVQAALKYVCQTYPHVKKFELADETHVKTPAGLQFITPRRLLTGRPGYFQEHFGAEPSAATRTLMRGLRDRDRGDGPRDVPTDATMDAICERAKSRGLPSGCLFGTTWSISRATVEAYAIGTPTVTDNATGGGQRHGRWLSAAAPRPVRPLRHPLSPLDAGL